MLFPDYVLNHVRSNFSKLHYLSLTVLACDVSDPAQLTFLPNPRRLNFGEFTRALESLCNESISVHVRNQIVAFVEGAAAVTVSSDEFDKRSRSIEITENGTYMLRAYLEERGMLRA